ncbi:MAG: hypothetical protein K6C36_06575 [Clostridia bacterium]|nr:hypothetical protein [Clostridia bacterium]
MRKAICIILAAVLCVAIAGCGSASDSRTGTGSQGRSVGDVLKERMNDGSQADQAPSGQPAAETAAGTGRVDAGSVDVDLTKLSSTLVYAEVYNMMTEPGSYLGKRIRMRGDFAYTEGDGRYYFACIISDATACCAQGIEFVLKDERKFPEEYPAKGTELTVVGIFDTYTEGKYQYCQLIDAVME